MHQTVFDPFALPCRLVDLVVLRYWAGLQVRRRDIPGSIIAFTGYARMAIRVIRRYNEAVGCSRGVHDAIRSWLALHWNLLNLRRDTVGGEAGHEFILLASEPGVGL